MAAHHPSTPRSVVVAGGGVAGVEALLTLREQSDDLQLDLIAADPDLVLRPLSVAAPFDAGEVLRVPLEIICADQGVTLHRDALTYADTGRMRAETANGLQLPYDALLLAVGARRRIALPGALTFGGPDGVAPFRELLGELADGRARSVAFAVPEGVTWSLPLYELALMTADELEGTGVAISLVTPETHPLSLFGRPTADRVRELLAERGIALRTRTRPIRVLGDFLLTSSGALRADRVVAMPALEGPRVPGVPADAGGFLPVDVFGAVRDAPGVFAAGDGTDTPVKQGGLAAQQAGAAATAIAARLGIACKPQPFTPELRAELLTGRMSWFMRGSTMSRVPLWHQAGKLAAPRLTPYLAGRLGTRVSREATVPPCPTPS